MGKKEVKTNAMRILDRKKISYEYQTYECDEFTDGIETADKLNLPHEQVYKTIVTTGKSGEHYVFVLPIEAEIDFKKAAKAVGEKSIEMLHLKELTPLTGYVRGGCTSIGMKKHFPTVIDASAQQFEKVYVSAGRIGAQLTLAPEDLRKAAILYAKADRAPIIYCLGVTEHSTGTEGVMSMSNMAMLVGKLGRPGCGVNPLRGQNNVQGACDMGASPNQFSGYQNIDKPGVLMI